MTNNDKLIIEKIKTIGFRPTLRYETPMGWIQTYNYIKGHIEYILTIQEGDVPTYNLHNINSHTKFNIASYDVTNIHGDPETNKEKMNDFLDKTFVMELRENTINTII